MEIQAGIENHSGLEQANQTIRKNEKESRELRGLCQNMYFILLLAGVTDIYLIFGKIINIVQSFRLLPHRRLEMFDKAVTELNEIVNK